MQRGLVGVLGVVDHDQQRAVRGLGEVKQEHAEAGRDLRRNLVRDLWPGEAGLLGDGRVRKQPFRLLASWRRQVGAEKKLAHHAERQGALNPGADRATIDGACCDRLFRKGVRQPGLAGSCPAGEYRHPFLTLAAFLE